MERFTERARRVLSLAHQEAQRTRRNNICSEHILVGLVLEEGGVAARVLRELGLTPDGVREVVKRITTASNGFDPSRVELAVETQQVLEFAVDETRRLGHHYIGTEHILLGLVLANSTGLEVLRRLGVTAEQIRRQTRRVLNESVSTVRPATLNQVPTLKKINHVFIVHGPEKQRKTVAALVQTLGLVPILLNANQESERLIDHLDKYSEDASWVVIILANKDVDALSSAGSKTGLRIDDNFIYELGYFRGKLGRNRICILYMDDFENEVELLSKFAGLVCIPLDTTGAWMTQLDKVIQDAGLKPDPGNIL